MTTFKALSKSMLALCASLAVMAAGACTALAAGEVHPLVGEFGSFTNPNGIAVEEATGDVYVADIGTQTVYKFDASGNPVNFTAGAGIGTNALTGTPAQLGKLAKSFLFPEVYGTPAAIAIDNSGAPSDPSRGDLYVMDAGHGVIDKFSPEGRYLSQIVAGGELKGLGVDGSGTVHVDLNTGDILYSPPIEEFDDAAVNHLIARQQWLPDIDGQIEGHEEGTVQADGFAVSATGDDYPVYEPSCSCTLKFGQKLSPLGRVDSSEAGDVAVAVDPATGHLYTDDQSSVAEWDTGAMNSEPTDAGSAVAAGTLVARFGSLQLSASLAQQGGIAVDGASGEIYVSNPSNGKVYVFGSDAPVVTVGEPTNVTRETASLSGTVDPRGAAVSKCAFEYDLTNEDGYGPYNHSLPCKQTQIGAGSSPVAVSAQLEGLKAGELYHFRLNAENANGSGESSGFLATQGEGFGIKSYEVRFLSGPYGGLLNASSSIEEDTTVDTQAGSHPSQFWDNFELYSHYERDESNADSRYLRVPDGVLRDVTVDLPPGFIGNPSATSAKCTGEELRLSNNGGGCPGGSAVGFLKLGWGGLSARVTNLGESMYTMVPHGVWLCSSAPISCCPCCISTMGWLPAVITPCRRRWLLRRGRRPSSGARWCCPASWMGSRS